MKPKSIGSVDANVSLVNESDKGANALLIYGVYDSQNRLIKAFSKPATAAAHTNDTININIDGLAAGYKVKAFVWRMPGEDFSSAYIPICEAIVYPL